MQYLSDQGFILRRVNFGDSDRYITIFTRNNGKIEVVARGVRKLTSRRAASCEPLNLIQFAAVKTAKNFILTEVKLSDSYSSLKKDLDNLEKVFTTCELIDALMPHNAPQIEVFDLTRRALSQMKNEKTLIYYQAKLLASLGYWDSRVPFRDASHIKRQIEMILERKLRSEKAFAAAPVLI